MNVGVAYTWDTAGRRTAMVFGGGSKAFSNTTSSRDATGLDVPLMRNSEYYVTDGNKNVIEMRNVSGAVTTSYSYDPFGNLPLPMEDNYFGFSSEYYDGETGLVYYNYRYYSPQLGRWIKRDPIGE